MADFSIYGGSADYEFAGGGSSSHYGVSINSTSWVEIINSTAFDAAGFYLFSPTAASAIADPAIDTFDLAIGASSSEKIILEQMIYEDTSSEFIDPYQGVFFPIPIPAGSRISGRVYTSSNYIKLALVLVSKSFMDITPHGEISTYGVSSGAGVQFSASDIGDSGSYGAWKEIVASTAEEIKLLYIVQACNSTAHGSNDWQAAQVAVGASSSEKIIVPRVVYAQDVTGDVTTPCINGPYPVDIPVGTRLSIRVKSSSISQGTMNFGLYGVK